MLKILPNGLYKCNGCYIIVVKDSNAWYSQSHTCLKTWRKWSLQLLEILIKKNLIKEIGIEIF